METSISEGREHKLAGRLDALREHFPAMQLGEFVGLRDYPGSRQKAKLAIFADGQGALQLGVYTLREQIPLADCPLYSEALQQCIAQVRALLVDAEVTPYDIHTRRGEGKFLLITESLPYADEPHPTFMVRLVLRSKEALARLQKCTDEFLRANPSIRLLSVNIQPQPAAILEGVEEVQLSSNSYFRNGCGDRWLNLTVRSFSQINSRVAFALYDYVRVLLEQQGVETLLDLYCGVGGFSLAASGVIRRAWGVEISADAVAAANARACELGLENFNYQAGDVAQMLAQAPFQPDAVVVNPPRAGLSAETVSYLRDSGVAHLIYSSCDLETFSRDALLLADNYELLSLKPFDMFMMTSHVEVVGYFRLRN